MGKQELTIYTCDRCGRKIGSNEIKNGIGHFGYLHVLKWWMPVQGCYKLMYLCKDCYKEFDAWINAATEGHDEEADIR